MRHFIFEFEFENDVKTYSIQTLEKEARNKDLFENDVKTYSIQTGFSLFEEYS